MGCIKSKSRKVHLDSKASSGPSTECQASPRNNKKRFQNLPEIEVPSNNSQEHCQPLSSRVFNTPPLVKEYLQESNRSTNNVINVLLLGESGVGKSTFINALVNYLTFDTLEEAHSKKPVALMPVSFLMTEGNDFDERTVRFGDNDFNEVHNQSGQSVTQRCKSYLFSIGTRHKLCLIDTPGMSDTRGPDQDDRNMQHILSYIDNLSHLNAICILLKPNESKLNVIFRSSFNQLVSFLGENISKNTIFCFTNTRSTFFTPGDTAPLLKKMLKNLPINNVPFEKFNTFCFDSESFRYLIARENGIKFDEYHQKEYKESWISSVNESNRFLQYICGELKSYPQTNWRSIEHAQFRIHKMLRPILETIRNIFRNLTLITENPSKPMIQLRLTPISQSSTICSQCKGVSQEYSNFLILSDDLHIYLSKCTKCTCSQEKHIGVSYRLDYDLLNDTNKPSVDELNQNLEQLQQASVKFGYFFLSVSHEVKSNDPILSYLDQMIKKEHGICQDNGSKYLNPQLLKKLNQFKERYEQGRSTLMLRRDSIDLSSIYELIQNINELDLIRKQMNVINDNN